MQTPRDILADLWASAGGDPAALDSVTLTGEEPQLPSSFRVAAAAQASIAAAGLAAAQIWQARSGQSQSVAVDMRHAVVECRSERYLRVDGQPPGPTWDAIAGVYKTRDRRFVRLHTNFPHHRAAVCQVLNCKPERDQVQAALMQWDGEAFETAAYAAGGVVALMRSHQEWSDLPHAKALAGLPVISIEKIGEAAPKPWPAGDRPLAGLRVLDLSRVIAGPVAGRTLAVHGADVLLVSGPELPAIPWLTIDTGRGKLSSFVELGSEQGARRTQQCCWRRRTSFRRAIVPARSQGSGSRPKMPQRSARASSMSRCRPMAMQVPGHSAAVSIFKAQTATGFNHAEGQAAGIDGPKELPAQMLDHATGHLMAVRRDDRKVGAAIARRRQLACPGVAGADRTMAVESRPR